MFNQSMKFVVVGLMNTLIGYLLFFVCLQFFHLDYTLSLVISHILGVFNSFIWNKRWTFNIRHSSKAMLIKFLFTYLVTFIINYLLLLLFVEMLLVNPVFSQLIAMVFTTGISFFGQKYWSFKEKVSESELK
ncbi:Putative flippase GtrA (transmembrane translocase of bactoprenol-linked glucose) [Paenibacillus algorifonticola]|uniref:Putative flippase GtrA (Transmembrane translocase of bactoprenol-linked glucose) n=1 Tax=Paenibacillus algorifonticola TaxID=684063 RepID=A0A1I2E0F6_9BACL|nr:GtrA family protein [Paenibacillus algorifonticola]SFE86169.1 Putative flippase GtrA (transmembrane translocase of bactoprenol-linked glucose) [Paenibacillus algorifonticola]